MGHLGISSGLQRWLSEDENLSFSLLCYGCLGIRSYDIADGLLCIFVQAAAAVLMVLEYC
jgi:hypothetical protein